MTQRRRNNTPVVVLLIVLLLLATLVGGLFWFISSHFFVGGKAYANDAEALDLRDQSLTVEEYETIRANLPDCEIRWSIPFQGSRYGADQTTILQVESLSDADLALLAYFEVLEAVDATRCQDYTMIQKLQEQYPDLDVNYNVTIAGQEYPKSATTVVCSTLTDEEIALMAMLPQLKSVDATGCQDPARIAALTSAIPGLEVSYQVTLLGQTFTESDVSATFNKPDVAALHAGLASLPHMETVHLVEPDADAASLRLLMETYPDITFTWDKTVLGTTFNSAETEFDLAETELAALVPPTWSGALDAAATAEVTKTVEAAMAYFPNAEKVILPAGSLDNETMAAFREKMRPEYKVVWTVYVTKKPVRTDQEVIHSSAYKVCFIDEQSQDLKYCEDAIVVDIGHSYVKNIEWVKGMPKLKYLILTHNWVKDLTPLSTCKELIYLELYWNDWIPDFTPLHGCTSLIDLNVSGTNADIEPLKQMTWLKNLWANLCGITPAEHQELQEALPNTTVMTQEGRYTGGGWRQVQGYYDMRDIMGLPYNTW